MLVAKGNNEVCCNLRKKGKFLGIPCAERLFIQKKNIENIDSSRNKKKSCGMVIKLYNSFGCLQNISLHEDKKESPMFVCMHYLQ
jgi:hypothetical protein